jgi:hypothetical protein
MNVPARVFSFHCQRSCAAASISSGCTTHTHTMPKIRHDFLCETNPTDRKTWPRSQQRLDERLVHPTLIDAISVSFGDFKTLNLTQKSSENERGPVFGLGFGPSTGLRWGCLTAGPILAPLDDEAGLENVIALPTGAVAALLALAPTATGGGTSSSSLAA